jgi:prepilin-type N-terminal cleavage/methylation domain-containing protein
MKKPHYNSSSRGFTLIELLVVVALIALISAMVMPSVSSYFQVSLNSATRDIASIVKESYNSTVLTGRVYRVVYDFKKAQYWSESVPMFFSTPKLLKKRPKTARDIVDQTKHHRTALLHFRWIRRSREKKWISLVV